ncbi:MAG TPA: YhcH/YjgK/YiaL family protein [Clostridiales bacterium]|nr:YhcH/YjgK/YiaL family protein [Clostridiales bacterium]
MVTDSLENLEHYASLHPRFPRAFAYLRALLASDAPDGKHVLAGTDTPEEIFVNICTVDAGPHETAVAESHEKYIDVQVILSGDELMFSPAFVPPVTEESAEKDYRLYAPVALNDCTRLCVSAAHFAIFFPAELHAPCHALSPSRIRKAIVKVLG